MLKLSRVLVLMSLVALPTMASPALPAVRPAASSPQPTVLPLSILFEEPAPELAWLASKSAANRCSGCTDPNFDCYYCCLCAGTTPPLLCSPTCEP